jgi:hypothetical protein
VPLPRPHPRPGTDPDTNPDDNPDLGPDIIIVPDPFSNPQPNPNPNPQPNPDPDNPNQNPNPDRNIPPYVPRSPQSIFAMFPFCIPWDVYNFVVAITAAEVEPEIEVDAFGFLGAYGINIETWKIEFSQFNVPRMIFRYGMLVLGLIGLFKVTRTYIWK